MITADEARMVAEHTNYPAFMAFLTIVVTGAILVTVIIENRTKYK